MAGVDLELQVQGAEAVLEAGQGLKLRPQLAVVLLAADQHLLQVAVLTLHPDELSGPVIAMSNSPGPKRGGWTGQRTEGEGLMGSAGGNAWVGAQRDMKV